MLNRLFIAARAAVFATGFISLWTWVGLWTMRFDRSLGVTLPAWPRPVGIVAAAVGVSLVLACIAVFVARGRGTPAPFDPPRVFVAVGPYALVRNPMYVGGWLAIAGFGLALGSPSVCLLSLAWLTLAHLFVVAYEEPVLAATFGESYVRYRASVPRWLPRSALGGRRRRG